jgi:hypothetical protein
MNEREYRKHKKALVERAKMLSVEALKASISDEWEDSKLPYLVFDAMTTALQKKLGTRQYTVWVNTLPVKLESAQ